jgi:hypothetical protein
MIIEPRYNQTLESLVKKCFPTETILLSQQKRVKIHSFIKARNFSQTKTEDDLYPYDIIETNKKIYFDKKNPIDPSNYFVIDKKDIVNIEDVVSGDQTLKKITMVPKRMFEFRIFHFTDVNPDPRYFIARFVYNITKIIDRLFGFAVAKMTTEITY